jgi:hypothetical protein
MALLSIVVSLLERFDRTNWQHPPPFILRKSFAGKFRSPLQSEVQWTHFWKGFDALFGAYVFAALASRRVAKPLQRGIPNEDDVAGDPGVCQFQDGPVPASSTRE